MTPSDVHKMMAASDGEWNMEIQMWMDPKAPSQSMKASCINKMILGGRYQESINSGSYNGMPFEGHSLTGWDNGRKIFVSTWIDNMGSGIMMLKGPWDEATKSITLKGKMTDPGTKTDCDIRETFQIIDDNTQEMKMYVTMPGEKEFNTMNIRYTRKK